jgi:hypothetical protein
MCNWKFTELKSKLKEISIKRMPGRFHYAGSYNDDVPDLNGNSVGLKSDLGSILAFSVLNVASTSWNSND